MQCISVHQPWAHAIMHLGKDVENRRWSTKYRGPLIIHASKTMASYKREQAYDWVALYGVPFPVIHELTFGAILGVVDVTDCTMQSRSRWAEHEWKWTLANPRPLKEPVAFRANQGLFSVGDSLEQWIAQTLQIK